MYVCSACKVTKYCSPGCQKADWNIHKKTCKKAAIKAPSISMSVESTPGCSACFIESLFVNQKDLWLAASENHPFLIGCADSIVSKVQFNTWLVQNYLYISCFEQFLDAVILYAPSCGDDKAILMYGRSTLISELAWFRERAKERGLDLSSTKPHHTTKKYKELLVETLSSSDDYLVQVGLEVYILDMCIYIYVYMYICVYIYICI
jgi:thiaminase